MPKPSEYIRGDQYLFKNKVLEIEEVCPGKFLLRVEKQFDLKAGQVVAVAADESNAPRIYSVCSGENDSFLQILFDLKEDGWLTPLMAKMKAGDALYVSKPYGSFLPDAEHPMWWIATGTGIAPFYAMMRSAYRPERLLHGARTLSNFYFEREFKETLREHYIRCSTGSDAQGDYFGRVTSFLENVDRLPTNNKYYLCGRALMVVEVRDLLISKGIPYGNIISEIFF
ncbi:FAD-binding oxidoreductase [Roseimarinus sediminis]|jgi:ferredoxin--NADP+ reductase|uniref:FAD-binding oxidoreductase n=1 Tax=Roseimarinus sediminis TaxID=1610899 RepID=UPI003D1E9304